MLPGFGASACEPIAGDGTALPVRWPDAPPVGKPVRLRVRAHKAKLFAVSAADPGETPHYRRFRAAYL